jgi:hypothetical protein
MPLGPISHRLSSTRRFRLAESARLAGSARCVGTTRVLGPLDALDSFDHCVRSMHSPAKPVSFPYVCSTGRYTFRRYSQAILRLGLGEVVTEGCCSFSKCSMWATSLLGLRRLYRQNRRPWKRVVRAPMVRRWFRPVG